jgi:type VI secretion system FHA domain protein
MTATLILVCDAIGSRHQFGPNGGAFGRSRKCDWVLPDPERHLSSVHARILYQNETFILVDESTNGTFLEGQSAAIGRGKAVSLSPGMKLIAGPYQIRVDALQAGHAAQTNPFAAPAARTPNRPAPAATPLRIDTSGASLPKNTSLDPLDHLGGGPETLTPVASVQTPLNEIPEPVSFAAPNAPPSAHETTRFQGVPAPSAPSPDLQPSPANPAVPAPALTAAPAVPGVAPQGPAPAAATQMPAPATPNPAPPAPPPASGNIIPENFLAGLGAPAGGAPSAPPSQRAQSLPDLSTLMPAAPVAGQAGGLTGGPAKAATIPDNIDFGIGAPPAAPSSSPASSLAPASAVAPDPATPQMPAAGTSPMQPSPAQPQALPGDPPVAPAPAAAAPPSEPPLNPLDALKKRRAQREAELAHKAKSRRTSSPSLSPAPAPAPAARRPGQAEPPATPTLAPIAQPPAPASQPPVPAAPQPPATRAPDTPVAAGESPGSEVFQALISGLGFADAEVPAEQQAEIARATGEMVRELANGLIALLNARKSLKTEFRMYETRIQPEENNPFKHFNVGELAIDEMLFARKGGFLPPPEAAKEAFRDLQSHTMLTVAATQRAMRIMFESLSPETLAGEEDDGGLRLRGLGAKRSKFEAAKERHDRLRADFDAVVRQTIAEAFVQVEEDQARQQSKTFWENRKK